MLVIGLTGGIGSGKTAASDYFASLGITVVDADLASRTVVLPGQAALNEIAAQFGDNMILPDGGLNRAALRELVFSDKHALKALEAITHPAIRTELLNQLQQSRTPYTILVSPLLLETNQHQLTDRVLLIDADETTQLDRTVQRDKVPRQQVQAIMAAQMARNIKQSKADDIVLNDSDLTTLHAKLDALHKTYLALAQSR